MMTDYTILAIIGIITLALVIISVVSIVGCFVYKYETLKTGTKTKMNTDLQNGKIEAELSVDIEGNSKSKRK